MASQQQQQGWRDPAFRDRARRTLHADQLARMEKVYTEPFYLLNRAAPSADASSLAFDVSGSKRDIYRVTLRPDGRMGCTCMDARLNCGRKGCVCKHACFVLVRVLRRCDLAFFLTGGLRLEGASAVIADFAAGLSAVTEEEMRPHPPPFFSPPPLLPPATATAAAATARVPTTPRRGISNISNIDFDVVKRPPGPEDECPVCYDLLLAGQRQRLVGCPTCGQGVHHGCVTRWLATSPHGTCVYCRSTVWRGFRP